MRLEEFFAKLSRKEKIGMIIGVAFLSLAILDRLALSPISRRVQQINQDIKIKEKELSGDLRNIHQKEIIAGEYQQYLKYVRKGGSDEEEIARILAEIEELARSSNVYLVDIKPQGTHQIDYYKEYAVQLEAEGRMENLATFLYGINHSALLLRAEKISLSLKEKESSTVKGVVLVTKVLVP